MTTLTDLSPEILHNLLCHVQALDLASLSQTCQYLRSFIAGDDLLWKRVYLNKFDPPRNSPSTTWAQALQNLVLTEKLLESNDHVLKKSQTPFLASQILPLLLSTAPVSNPLNTAFLARHFHHAARQSNASTLLRQSSLFHRCGLPFDEPAPTIAARQASARLHVYSSLPLDLRATELIDIPGAVEIHPYARSRVYDLRRYKALNFWGPFMDDGSGRIDWEKIQAVFIVLGFGLRMLSERSGGVVSGGSVGWGGSGGDWEGLAANSYKSASVADRPRDDDEQSTTATAGSERGDPDGKIREVQDSDTIPSLDAFMMKYRDPREAAFQHEQANFAAEDPYGVKGTWMRIVNFLDYHDLFAFNFTGHTPPEGVEREPVSTAEAFRLIFLKLWVTKIEWPDDDADEWETVDGGSQASSPAATTTTPTKPTPSGCEPETEETVEASSSKTNSAKPQRPGSDATSTTKDQRKQRSKYPIVHFAGRSRSLHIRWDPNANSHIRGYVRAYPAPPTPAHEYIPKETSSPNLSHVYPSQSQASSTTARSTLPATVQQPALVPDDDLVIRWTTFSVFHGEERWRSEGVQIGGLKSARGILGNWFDKDYDPHGPAGPTGFWKIGDQVEMYNRNRSLVGWGDDEEY